jgi:hypothetical protein
MKNIIDITREHITKIATSYSQVELQEKMTRIEARKQNDPGLIMLAQVMARAVAFDQSHVAAVVDLSASQPERQTQFLESAFIQAIVEWEAINEEYEAQFPKPGIGMIPENVKAERAEPTREEFAKAICDGLNEMILMAKKANLEEFKANEWGRDRAVGLIAAKQLVEKLTNEPWDTTDTGKRAETAGRSTQ